MSKFNTTTAFFLGVMSLFISSGAIAGPGSPVAAGSFTGTSSSDSSSSEFSGTVTIYENEFRFDFVGASGQELYVTVPENYFKPTGVKSLTPNGYAYSLPTGTSSNTFMVFDSGMFYPNESPAVVTVLGHMTVPSNCGVQFCVKNVYVNYDFRVTIDVEY